MKRIHAADRKIAVKSMTIAGEADAASGLKANKYRRIQKSPVITGLGVSE